MCQTEQAWRLGGTRFACSSSMRHLVMDAAHCSPLGGHSDRERTIHGVEWVLGGPGITYDV